MLVVIGLVAAGGIYWTMPEPVRPTTPAELRRRAESLTLSESVQEWGDLLRGLDSRPPPAERAYHEGVQSACRWLYVAAAIGAAGLATMASGLIARRGSE